MQLRLKFYRQFLRDIVTLDFKFSIFIYLYDCSNQDLILIFLFLSADVA